MRGNMSNKIYSNDETYNTHKNQHYPRRYSANIESYEETLLLRFKRVGESIHTLEKNLHTWE